MTEVTDKVPLTTTYAQFKEIMDSMKVGESFAVSVNDKQMVRYCAWKYFHRKEKSTGLPITTKIFTVKEHPKGESIFRCWRAE